MSFPIQPTPNFRDTSGKTLAQVQFKILAFTLLPAGFTPFFLMIYYVSSGEPFSALHTLFYASVFIGTQLLLLIKHSSLRWTHLIFLIQTGVVWALLCTHLQNTHIITLQFALLVSLCCFYVLGKVWACVYTLFCLLPCLGLFWVQYTATVPAFCVQVSKGPVLAIVLLVNLLFISFVQYYFFTVFTQTIQELNTRTLLLNETVKALENSRDGLRQQSRLQKKLIAAITHDIKSPLKYLMLTGKNLYRNSKQLNSNSEQSIRAIYTSAFQMYHFTNNLLQYASLYQEDTPITASSFNLDDLVQEKISIFKEMISSQNNKVVNNIPAHLLVCTNKELLSVIIHNLLDNAIKYTSNGHIYFSANQHRGKLQLCIQDTGIGMAPELVNWCNNRQAVKDFMIENEAHGLGWAMVKELIGLIKGHIMVQSKSGSGTLILLLLSSEV